LIKRLPKYKLEEFFKLLKTRENEIDEQLLEMLISFTDFNIFKEIMLDHKMSKNSDIAGIAFNIEKPDFN
jgi:hypothetical protein